MKTHFAHSQAVITFPARLLAGNFLRISALTLLLWVSLASGLVQAQLTFAHWETGFSISSGAAATPFNDGIPNLLKYLCDFDPTQAVTGADRVALPTMGMDTTSNPGTTYLTLTYRQYVLSTGITVSLQSSTDLVNWNTVTPDIDQQNGTDPNTNDPILEMGVIYTGTAKQFLRFSINDAGVTINIIPEGLLSLNLPASGGGLSRYFSLPMITDPVYSGTVGTVTTNTISVTVDGNDPAPFVNPAVGAQLASLTTSGFPYFVKFLSGQEAGRVILVTANTTNTLTLDTTDNSSQTTPFTTTGFTVNAGDTFELCPGTTLGTLFGDNASGNPLLLHGATNSITADTVGIYNPSLFRYQVYFYNVSAAHWEVNGSTANANNTIIYPYSALSILRRSSEAALAIVPQAMESSMVIPEGQSVATLENILVPMSRVTEVPTLTKVTGNNKSVFGSTTFPVNVTFAQLQLGAAWKQNNSPAIADTISIYNTTSFHFDTYYQLPDLTWRLYGNTAVNQSTTVIPAGTQLGFLQRGGVSLQASFLTSVLPYSPN